MQAPFSPPNKGISLLREGKNATEISNQIGPNNQITAQKSAVISSRTQIQSKVLIPQAKTEARYPETEEIQGIPGAGGRK